ncbi:RNA polymerase sigma factor [Mycobacterium simiae]|uniref:RNA polymerase subunit sigma-70 n=1 Tax=Mycobacterium simiae TaxID=1784 RepID=A0A1X0YHC5_MYCSI|nr:sigma-70 family RNA polymerase sigma factor [Mycobacterium simiae]ORJ64767.1 RNA polymerase subunit sigma-70 [Mycobacterium simiae]
MATPVTVPSDGTRHQVAGIPLTSLVRDFHRPMVKFARTMVNSPAVAEEAVQEAWVQVLLTADSFEGRSSVGTWLFGIVRHTALRYRRRESRIRDHEVLATAEDDDPLSGRMHPDGHPDAGHWSLPPSRRFLPEDRTVAQELVDYVRTALDALPQRQRQLVILRDLVGASAEEAAEILQLTPEGQRALLYRARGNLRNELEKRYCQ